MPRVSCAGKHAVGFLLFVLQAGSVTAQPTSTQNPTDSPRIISFKREAERAVGKSIHISYADGLGPDAGNSHCEDNPVEIKIDKKFRPKTQELLVAHELGHIMLCSRHIEIKITYYPHNIPLKMMPLLDGLASQIKSCFLDPLANAEAEKRGFAVKNLEKLAENYFKSANKSELKQSIAAYGEYSRDFSALSIYCFEVRANMRIPEADAFIADEPEVLSKLQSLRSNLGTPTCVDEFSCYYLSKRLRDQFNWKSFLQMENPATSVRE